jgi:hypothetical protein
MHPMPAQDAIAELASNIQYTQPAGAQAHLDMLGDLVRGRPCYTLRTGLDFDNLSQTLRALIRTSASQLE